MLATRFIIALCPATPIYLAAPSRAPKGAITRVKDDACRFDTFEAAMEVAKDITGWGGAQRVEQIAVQVPDPQSLATEDACDEVRDAATCAWNECADCDSVTVRVRHTEDYLRSIGLKVGSEVRAGASCPATLYLADHLGNTMQLDWDPMQDGFDITEATTAADAKPRTAVCDCCARRRPQSMVHTFEDTHEDGTSTQSACEDCIVDAPAEPDHGCAGNCKPLSPKAARALRKWGNEKCQRAWHLNRLRGEGLTVCSIETGIPVRSVNSAINAWQEVWEQLFVPQTCSDCGETNDTVRILDLGDGGHALCSKCNTPDIIPCDGCDSTDAEPCGDSDGHAFCAACRAKDSAAAFTPHSVDADATAKATVITAEEIAAAVRRNDCATVTLTDAQRERAAVLLTDALRGLIKANLPRLIGNAQLDAAEETTAREQAPSL